MEREPSIDTYEHEQLAQQLRCPAGDVGRELGHLMYESNKGMIARCLEAMNLNKKERILEIGPGTARHLGNLLERTENLKYFGLDISSTMVEEASLYNRDYLKKKSALFCAYDGEKIPYVACFFNKGLSVNTIYFWEHPERFLKELYRVLKPGGIFVLGFADEYFMRELPFVNSTFTLYDYGKLEALVATSALKVQNVQMEREASLSKTGRAVEREFTIVTLKKEDRPTTITQLRTKPF